MKVKPINNVISKLKNVNTLAETIGLMRNDNEIRRRENTTDNGNVIKKVTAKQNAINTATQNIQNSYDKTESESTGKRKSPLTFIPVDSMVKDIKGWKM